VRREKHDADGGEECDDEDGKGYPNDTQLYEDMHANDIRKKGKIKEYATTKVPNESNQKSIALCCVV
jgi:hypothetical protein